LQEALAGSRICQHFCKSFPLAAESISIFAGAFRWRLRASAFLQELSAGG